MEGNQLRKWGMALLLVLSVVGMAGCDNEGPAEQAGENIDESMEQAGETMEELGDNIQESADEAQEN
ncbi:hypothetical protein [Litchfieldella xinjiangensis]|uniref:hypothetical protein n=1 Tax=Litchfieldella xinjiangensis TaxID=1166948 RepID=UPI0005B78800|nr:hypothetical protein [Halomonas xinjiangensis]